MKVNTNRFQNCTNFWKATSFLDLICLTYYNLTITCCIEFVVARSKSQFWCKRCEEIEHGPGDDNHVVYGDHRDNHQGAVAQTTEYRGQPGECLIWA